jgi:coenzyme F420-0:L-glutamate ligase/coenzyme F420-1:gamma-L-glutamate ligase
MTDGGPSASGYRVGSELLVRSVPGVPTVERGADLGEVILEALKAANMPLANHDVIVVASKVVSRAEDCFVDLGALDPGPEALRLAAEVDKDPRLVELILRESSAISRKVNGALIVRHRLGFVSANAGIDASNATPSEAHEGSGPWVLTLPEDPDRSAARIRDRLSAWSDARMAVLITDSWGRPFRRGTVGFALGVSGLPPLWDRRGARDRHGRELEATDSAIADSIAAAADLVAGQAAESRPVTLVRGIEFSSSDEGAVALLRDPQQDLYA